MLDLLREKEQDLIALRDIKIDGGTQMRAALNNETVNEYEGAIGDGAIFPPVIVFHDGSNYWLGDGFHRVAAYKRVHALHKTMGKIAADVRSGTRRDAVLYAAGANADHGLRRSNADKRRAVETLLGDAEWSQWSNREIARRCRVDESMVRDMRGRLTAGNPQLETTERKYIDQRGNERVMETARIGAAPKPSANGNHRTPTANRSASDAVTDAWDDPVIIWCPRCHAEQEDHDGFGVIHCDACGYCVHPSATGQVCDLCGAYVGSDPAIDAATVTSVKTELSDEIGGIIDRLTAACGDIESAKRVLGAEHITIAERAASHTRILVRRLEELKECEL